MRTAALLAFATLLAVAPATARELDCGTHQGFFCHGAAGQYGGSFTSKVGHGGFGGADDCVPQRTPVVFFHGNGDAAPGWDSPPAPLRGFEPPPRSVYDELRAHGYQACELYGVTYLSESERKSPERNYHRIDDYDTLVGFIGAVKAHTGQSKVDVVAHSLGVTLALAALDYHGEWGSVRRFVNIAGGLRGLDTCYKAGWRNPFAPTCYKARGEHEFGFYPDGTYWWFYRIDNRFTGAGPDGLRRAPERQPQVAFYTLHAGAHDQVHCGRGSLRSCADGALFAPAPNVRAQLNIGTGTTAGQLDWDWSDGLPSNLAGGDRDGIGHFHARANAGALVRQMLTSECRDADCASGYRYGPVH
jgi:pimeloyl-ACP methyl ester carboxylesterase